jgi:hypothetical protein
MDHLDTSTMLCAWCSVMHASALCERCRALVASGKNRGPLPSFLLTRVERSECWGCRPPDPTKNPDPVQAKFCARHVEASLHRRRLAEIPLEFDRPQVRARNVGPHRRDWFA